MRVKAYERYIPFRIDCEVPDTMRGDILDAISLHVPQGITGVMGATMGTGTFKPEKNFFFRYHIWLPL